MNKKEKKHAAGVKKPCKVCGDNLVAVLNLSGICTSCTELRAQPSMPVLKWLTRPMP